MARRARLSWPGGVFHVISRFARDAWWLDREGARQRYLDLLGQAAETSKAQVVAYCLMSNHVHLVVIQGDRPLERFMKSLHTAFAAWLRNTVKGRATRGPVFADRPRTILVERDRHLADLVRYVHNNPVRAGVVRYARNSDWTSHKACTGRVPPPKWLNLDHITELFGPQRRRAAERFDHFVNEGRKQPRRPELSGVVHRSEASAVRQALGSHYRISHGIFGSDAFIARVRASLARAAATRTQMRETVSKATTSLRTKSSRADAFDGATVHDVLEIVLQHLKVDREVLEQSPRSRRAASVKRVTIWVWIRFCNGRPIDAARALPLDNSIVSRYYGQAVAASEDLNAVTRAVTRKLRQRLRENTRGQRPSQRSPAPRTLSING